MAGLKAPVVITANDLLSGEVVYLSPLHAWLPTLVTSQVYQAIEQAEAVLAQVAIESEVIGPYLMEVAVLNDVPGASIVPKHYREEFRRRGPSNYFHGKQEHSGNKVVS